VITNCCFNSTPPCRSALKKGTLCLVAILFFNLSIAQKANRAAGADAGKTVQPAEATMKAAGIAYKSGNRRDPFLNLLLLKKDRPAIDEEMSRGVPPPGIAGTYIDQALLQGVSMRDNGRLAVVRGADKRAYFLREGDKLFDGYLKNVEIDSITLVRVTKMRSGKILTQDVTKRLRTQ
jgi:hypothetical protein